MAVNPRIRRQRSNERRPWPAARPSPSTPKPARRRRPAPPGGEAPDPGPAPGASLDEILDRFTESWDRGEGPRAEGYLGLLPAGDLSELIYREFCLAEETGLDPEPAEFLRRFPDQSDSLRRLFSLHGAISASCLRGWVEPSALPEAGDSIGPYRLLRELGRGAFARVFLAEQSDLGDRLVVLKVSSRPSAESSAPGQGPARPHRRGPPPGRRRFRIRRRCTWSACRSSAAPRSARSSRPAARSAGGSRTGPRPAGRPRPASRRSNIPDPTCPGPPARSWPGCRTPMALAWVGARLAEALDHAQAPGGGTHGDLKPSNILLTAEGMPMLFDFNLAVDWRDAGPGEAPAELGGTLAYMAPERLRAIAGEAGAEGRAPRPLERHRADLYALGLVLLEALTGLPPEVPDRRPGDARGLASATAALRVGLTRTIRSASVPPALRSILGRCLAPDPADRYARGAELARDLDLWRAEKPLVFAPEPRRSVLLRHFRRGRKILLGAATTLAAAAIVGSLAQVASERTGRDKALDKLAAILDRADSGAFSFRKLGQWRVDELGDPAEGAGRQLERYGASSDVDWRSREDVRSLPGRDREELEAWLLEQAFRRAVALADRPDREDWGRAEALLAMTVARAPLAPLTELRLTLRHRLQLPPPGPPAAATPAPPAWLGSYLAGVAAEPLHAREALGHYRDALRGRPGLFWAHYRAAAVACRIDEYPEAAEHLRDCVDRRPKNPALRAQLAAVLFRVEQDTPPGRESPWPPGSALAECDKALDIDPDFSEAIFTRALIRRASGQPEGVRADIGRFALLTRARGEAPALALRMKSRFHYGANYTTPTDADHSLTRQVLAEAPRDLDTRAILGSILVAEGREKDAVEEFEKVLGSDPDHLRARYLRAIQFKRVQSPAALVEFAALIDHPRFEEVFREQPTALRAYHYVATDLLDRGRFAEALEVAGRALAHANRSRSFRSEILWAREKTANVSPLSPRGETYYLIARIHAGAASSAGDREHMDPVIDNLDRAFACSRSFREKWFATDHHFDRLRGEILARLPASPADR